MASPYPIERYKTLTAGEEFNLPDGWVFYSYRCGEGATVTYSNSLGESQTDNESGSSINQFPSGFEGIKFKANSGTVLIKYY
ncbi:MAG TPA: hypothetical protein VF691_04240 [Cytophagaceae bacterium]|jgi:hypothetical protein